jgi:hypothetical protein
MVDMNPYLDAAVDGLYTAGTTLLGYMVASGGAVMPTKAGLLVSLVTGVLGFANHLRGLRKPA